MKKIVGVFWHSAAERLKALSDKYKDIADVSIYSLKTVEQDAEMFKMLCSDLDKADIMILNLASSVQISSDIKNYIIDNKTKKIFVGSNAIENVVNQDDLKISAEANEYYIQNGEKNLINLIKFAANKAGDVKVLYDEPQYIPMEAISHPGNDYLAECKSIDDTKFYFSFDDYIKDYPKNSKGTVAILMSRSAFVNDDLKIEKAVINSLEKKGLRVLPIFAYAWEEPSIGAKGSKWAIEKFCFDEQGNSVVNAIIKMTSFFIGGKLDEDTIETINRLNCPIFKPICSYNMSNEEWNKSKGGTLGDVAWSISLPELEGNIEPLFIGGLEQDKIESGRSPIMSRVEKLTDRVAKWVSLGKKNNADKKIVFVLNNNPCASTEASVGGGAKLDTLESVVRIIKRLKEDGYSVGDYIPDTGEDLIREIMEKKAISEFRWTTVGEIVEKGGCIYKMDNDTYLSFFNKIPKDAQKEIIDNWGNPPGEGKDGVPPAMVHEGKICITGLKFGNVLVCVQPKRGCAGSECNGTVCKILHDPHCPPTHQYIATYKYFENIFKTDCIIHVGTHGNLEFLPGNGTALSDSCYTDICIGNMPNLYIYNADNPPEGTIAKRRALATIVDHMQTVHIPSGLYDELEIINQLLQNYDNSKELDKAQAHQLKHQVIDAILNSNIKDQIKTDISIDSFDKLVNEVHDLLTLIGNSQIQDGLHIFDDIPSGERRIDLIYGILRYEDGDTKGIRRILCDIYGLDFEEMLKNPSRIHKKYNKRYGDILRDLDSIGREFVKYILKDMVIDESIDANCEYRIISNIDNEDINYIRERINDLDKRIEMTAEMDNLIGASNGTFVPPGPSGVVTRGRDDIIPTGRNFYTLDSGTLPTKAAWVTGQRLADSVIDKFIEEEKRYPDSFGMYWMCNDILWAGGEGLAQLLYFMGVRPKWKSNGKVDDYEIISLKELKRPRIDISVKVSGILRDNFKDRMDILDRAVREVALLEEPIEMNYVRKHTYENINSGMTLDESVARIFGSRPGTYLNGITLQVYSSAWKDKSEMVDVFTFFNGYSYSKNVYGKEAYKALQNSLKNVDITYNKVMTDESDLLGCCTYYGVQGGMTAAARQLSGKAVKAYYGDSRESMNVQVRTMSEELNRVVQSKLLNPKWIEGMKEHGYKGAGDISKKIGNVYGWEATTDEVEDWVFNEITRTYIENEENNRFFKENNPWALEEIERRLIEANRRGLWNAPEDILENLENDYLELEGVLEESSGGNNDNFQGGDIDVNSIHELEHMKNHIQNMKEMLK